jgi:ubiquitin-protein ligase
MRESPRIRRLRSDLKALMRLKQESTIFDFTAYGDPPHTYLVRFQGRGLSRSKSQSPVDIRSQHEVRVELGASYPRLQPELEWQTPIFHPNISAGGVVCLGGYGTYWVPSLNLDELCEMLWDMIRYANFDVNSPYNREAAGWARLQSEYRFPVDPRPIRDNLANSKQELPTVSEGRVPQPHAIVGPSVDALRVANPAPGLEDILFIDDDEIVEAEAIDDDSDILVIE